MGFIPIIHKEHLQLNKENINNPAERWANDMKGHFIKRKEGQAYDRMLSLISCQGNAS